LIVPPPGLGGLPLGVHAAEAPGLSGGFAPESVREVEWPLAVLIETWPDPVRTALLERAAEGACVSLPAAQIREGLAKGRVTVTWGVIRKRITPEPVELPSVSESLELVLPLQVVASAFLKEAAPKKTVPEPEMPSLFSGAPVSREPGPAPEAAPAPPEFKLRMPEVFLAEPGERAAAGSAPTTPDPSPVALPSTGSPRTLGALFGDPDRAEWSPGEIVEHLARLPEVAGALVGLEEGLLVAHSLPGSMKGEVVAAVLPQIFSRIHGYARDMGLAEVEHLQMATKEGDFRVFRLGFVFFAVLTKKGAVLPAQDLQLLCEELTRQTREAPVAPAQS
jgi:predicted regulator of Ras-like GTPase activity (Roadblock/LC7/MglB family)